MEEIEYMQLTPRNSRAFLAKVQINDIEFS